MISDVHSRDPCGVYHGDSNLQHEQIDVYYDETSGRKCVPSAILVDLDPDLRNCPTGASWSDIQSLQLRFQSELCWQQLARGHYTAGAEFVDPVMDVV
jgi:tubulin beta